MADQVLRKLVRERATLKSFFTRFRTAFQKIDINNQQHLQQLQLRCKDPRFFKGLRAFNKIQTRIEEFDPSDQTPHHDEERTQFEDSFMDLTSLAINTLKDAELFDEKMQYLADAIGRCDNNDDSESVKSTKSQDLQTNSVHEYVEKIPEPCKANSFHELEIGNNTEELGINQTGNLNQDSCLSKHINLPPIQIPTFSGDYDQWISFRDSFKSLIHDNCQIPAIMKFHHLKGLLKGNAAQILKAVEPSHYNYEIVWTQLNNRYQNTDMIIDNHIKAIVDEEPLQKENLSALQQLANCIFMNLRALKSLGEPVDSWASLIIHLINAKFDHFTKTGWANFKLQLKKRPNIQDLEDFLTRRCQFLESMLSTKGKSAKLNSSSYLSRDNNANSTLCKLCNGNHPLFYCKQFLNLDIQDRIKKITDLQLCKNCFKPYHTTKNCKSKSDCKVCHLKHNTLLHIAKEPERSQNTEQIEQSSSSHEQDHASSSASIILTTIKTRTQILLPSALVYIYDHQNKKRACRVLLDSCSQSNYISTDMFKKLGYSGKPTNFPITGINNTASQATTECTLKFQSRFNKYNCKLTCQVLPTITACLPDMSFNTHHLNIPQNIQLADPEFNKSNTIDALIGSEIFWDLLCIGKIDLGKRLPICQKTHFGWIVTGPMAISSNRHNNNESNTNCLLSTSLDRIDCQLRKFWEIEETTKPQLKTQEHSQCESIFANTTTRENGRFVVRLPFKPNAAALGESYSIAKKRFNTIERKFRQNSNYQELYSKFMEEYEQLGHMSRVHYDETDCNKAYYLPHHAVLREESTTTKLRVVFDASCKTNSGTSLNDTLMVGGSVQSDIFSILIDFRAHKYAFTSDCEKMYRQILVHPNDRIYQNILWRANESEELNTYQLNTVTYGTAAAPFLATRCLDQISQDILNSNPQVAEIIKTNFYMDDLIVSIDDYENAMKIITDTNSILSAYHFSLRKWTTNHPSLFHNVDIHRTSTQMMFSDPNKAVKVLGLSWNAKVDHFMFNTNFEQITSKVVSKRMILSLTSQLFDPLGLLAPIIVRGKIIIQRLWQLNLAWDESIPMGLFTSWTQFYNNLSLVNTITIPRLGIIPNYENIQMHGFCDASEQAYGACIYLRSSKDNVTEIHLLCSKSKVAPLKKISLPRLELCAAVLLVRLKERVLKCLKVKIDEIHLWSDSTITLAWISIPSYQLQTFVANRVSEIIETTNLSQWHHVRSGDNPADLVSRGMSVDSFINNQQWFHGPDWLKYDTSEWPINNNVSSNNKLDLPELKKNVNLLTQNKSECNSPVSILDQLLERFSSINTLQRVLAYAMRFYNNLKKTSNERNLSKFLSVSELEQSMHKLIEHVQKDTFSNEINCLRLDKQVSIRSSIRLLNPFLHQGILRVGGRLCHSNLTFNQKHQIILPHRHKFTNLIIQREHLRTLHGGPQQVLSALRSKFWPIAGMSVVRKVINSCMICRRVNPQKSINPLMGDLPKGRVVPSRPFYESGVDYAGPFNVKELTRTGRRSNQLLKAYIAIFVCFATKAIHIEVVSSLSTEAFLNSLKRFISRRGICKFIHSDNGTNFRGASNEMKLWYKLISSQQHNDSVSQFCANSQIEWKFIPARSPHFGGLWEAAVKSVKRHLLKATFNSNFNFEELTTIVAQIEAILNSRPLIALTSDPKDSAILTPGHFLVGEALLAPPEPDVSQVKIGRLSRFQLIQQIQQQFWKQWSRDYLNHLQARSKQFQNGQNAAFKPGQLVLLKDQSAPLHWKRGRILQLHPGADGIVRVVTIRTTTGVTTRATNQLVLLLPEN